MAGNKGWMNGVTSLDGEGGISCTAKFPCPFPLRVQELKLEEQQCQLDQELRQYYNMEGKREERVCPHFL